MIDEKKLAELRNKVDVLVAWPMRKAENGHRMGACGIGCDMGDAGPGPVGFHDPDCLVAELPEVLDTLAALWKVSRLSRLILARMKKINGPRSLCKIGNCVNHAVIDEMEEALAALDDGKEK